ncbi:MAG: formylglycine-generating enzyme family protein [Anaerolineae bacterium]|nr:formylglycine-generating enzyme family protein [Anaerolineae bacterium]
MHEQCFDSPFWIDKTEVTRAKYKECVSVGDCIVKPTNDYSSQDIQPVNYVEWFAAYDYCQWRGGRLPTEREWEYAARGPDNLVYPWGNEFVAENVVYSRNSGNMTSEVSTRPDGESWVGALDMSGNVWEWVSTIYIGYPYRFTDYRESNENLNSRRGLRGGSIYNTDEYLRSANRFVYFTDGKVNSFGFRCARDYE